MKDMDELLKQNLLSDCVPDESLNASILEKAKETLLAMMKERSVTVLSSASALSSSSLDLEIRSLPFAP